jgi:hypothetical protein
MYFKYREHMLPGAKTSLPNVLPFDLQKGRYIVLTFCTTAKHIQCIQLFLNIFLYMVQT